MRRARGEAQDGCRNEAARRASGECVVHSCLHRILWAARGRCVSLHILDMSKGGSCEQSVRIENIRLGRMKSRLTAMIMPGRLGMPGRIITLRGAVAAQDGGFVGYNDGCQRPAVTAHT